MTLFVPVETEGMQYMFRGHSGGRSLEAGGEVGGEATGGN